MKARSIRLLALAGTLTLSLTASQLVAEKASAEPKYSVDEVMKKLHKPKDGNPFGRIVAGKGTEADKKLVVDCYESMVLAKPEKGDPEHWKKMSESVLASAKAVAGGDDKAIPKLKEAANCKACHEEFRE